MRKLHPSGPTERLLGQGKMATPMGEEVWTEHSAVGERTILRVERADGSLWHLTLDAACRPERMQVRLQGDGGVWDATWTFFEDEALVWRRGGGQESEAVPLPPGYRLLWPPFAGRGRLLDFAAGDPAGPIYRMSVVPIANGGVQGEVLQAAVDASAVAQTNDGLSRDVTIAATGSSDGTPRWTARARVGAGHKLEEWEGPDGHAIELSPAPAAADRSPAA